MLVSTVEPPAVLPVLLWCVLLPIAAWWSVPRWLGLAERTVEPPGPDFVALATPGFRAAVGLTTLVAGVVVALAVPVAAQPVWCGLVLLGPLLGWIDAATTWLPARLTHWSWLLTGLGMIGTAVLGLTVAAATGVPWWHPPLGAVVGAAVVGGFFAVVWWLGRGALGFGDVRLAIVLGAATGALGPATVVFAVLVGTGSAAIWALLRAATGRRDAFPYGPFLLVGAFLAPLMTG